MSFANIRGYSYTEFMLALTAWREARGESAEGIKGVVWSIRNRFEAQSWYGKDYIECVTKAYQYSSISDPNDRQLTRFPSAEDLVIPLCLEIVAGVLDDLIEDPTCGATHYFDDSLKNNPPRWARADNFTIKIGRLNFHKGDA